MIYWSNYLINHISKGDNRKSESLADFLHSYRYFMAESELEMWRSFKTHKEDFSGESSG